MDVKFPIKTLAELNKMLAARKQALQNPVLKFRPNLKIITMIAPTGTDKSTLAWNTWKGKITSYTNRHGKPFYDGYWGQEVFLIDNMAKGVIKSPYRFRQMVEPYPLALPV